MATVSSNNASSFELMAKNFINKTCPSDPIKSLYPMVNEEDTPLPRHWNPKDRFSYLGLASNNLRVLYKGSGKNHKDAASVRATHPIPGACAIYYFEVKVISKGRDGYMGIGLSTFSVNLNRLPGWDKNSYGYHGDDGNSFCCSGTGQPYGPTFTTGDIIGCCVNLIDGSCFYTKNGVNLGIAFRDLPPNLYPTVGLQTPGEIIEANFGQSPFVFNISDYVKEWEMKTKLKIENFPIPNAKGEWQVALQKIVITYLIHHGYYATAKAFADSTRQQFDEDKTSIQNRQKIQRLILSGQIGEAIQATEQLYPGLLEHNRNLLFMLKCRQFIEMVNGTDVVDPASSPKSSSSTFSSSLFHSSNAHMAAGVSASPAAPVIVAGTSPCVSPTHSLSNPLQTTMSGYHHPHHQQHLGHQQDTSSSHVILPKNNSHSPNRMTSSAVDGMSSASLSDETMNSTNLAMNGSSGGGSGGGRLDAHLTTSDARQSNDSDDDDEMDVTEIEELSSVINGASALNGTYLNGSGGGGQSHFDPRDAQPADNRGGDIAVDQRTPSSSSVRPIYAETHAAIECILQFGRDLHAMGEQMKREFGENEANNKALKDAFSLLAYSDPWNSPVGHQLNPIQREPVCTALNSAILDLQGFPKQPPLEVAITHATQCLKLMSKTGIGSCAFASISDTLR